MKKTFLFLLVLAACSHKPGDQKAAKSDDLLQRIEAGEPEALNEAVELRKSADASRALELRFAVARAIPVAPQLVMALTKKGFPVNEICTSPFIEPEPGVAEAYVKDAERALKSLFNTPLGARAKQCLKKIRP